MLDENFVDYKFVCKNKIIVNMKKVIILAGLLLFMSFTAFADQRGVFMDIYIKSNPEKNMEVNRSPMRLSIEVIYDSDTHKIEVTGNKAIEAEVFLYDVNGILEAYSSTLNTDFTVFTPGTYIIQIQSNEWYAEGKIEM